MSISDKELKKIAGGAYVFVDPPTAGEHMRTMAHELLLARKVADACEAQDKCPFCGDNQDHHPKCEIAQLRQYQQGS